MGWDTSILEYGSSFHRHRQFRGNWVEEVPPGRSLTLRYRSLEVPLGMKGVLVYLFTMNTLGSGESHWWRMVRASETSILTSLQLQNVVTMPRSPFATPSVIKITIGAAWPLSLRPVSVRYSTLVFPQMVGDATWVKNFSDISLNWITPTTGISRSDVHSSPKMVPEEMDLLLVHHIT